MFGRCCPSIRPRTSVSTSLCGRRRNFCSDTGTSRCSTHPSSHSRIGSSRSEEGCTIACRSGRTVQRDTTCTTQSSHRSSRGSWGGTSRRIVVHPNVHPSKTSKLPSSSCTLLGSLRGTPRCSEVAHWTVRSSPPRTLHQHKNRWWCCSRRRNLRCSCACTAFPKSTQPRSFDCIVGCRRRSGCSSHPTNHSCSRLCTARSSCCSFANKQTDTCCCSPCPSIHCSIFPQSTAHLSRCKRWGTEQGNGSGTADPSVAVPRARIATLYAVPAAVCTVRSPVIRCPCVHAAVVAAPARLVARRAPDVGWAAQA